MASYTEALAIRRKALPKDHPNIADSLNDLGGAHLLSGRHEASMASYTEVLALRRKALPKDHPDIAQTLSMMGMLELLTGVPTERTRANLGEALAINHARLNQLAGFQAEAEQLAASDRAQNGLHMYLAAVVDSGSDAAAIYHQVAGLKGAVTARQRWTREVRDPADATTVGLLTKLIVVNRELLSASLPGQPKTSPRGADDHRKRLDELQEQRNDLERQLSAHSEAYRLFQAKAKLGGEEVRVALPTCTCLLDIREYVHYILPLKGQKEASLERRFIAFVVQPGKGGAVAMVPLGKGNVIDQSVARWRASYGVGKLPPVDQLDPAAELRKLVWEPLAKHIGKDAKTVLISPDGSLTGLPFAALPGAKKDEFLLHEYAFATVPVPILLPEMMARKADRPKQPGMLLMGGIDFGDGKPAVPEAGSKLPPVPVFGTLGGTDREVNDVRALFEDRFPDAAAPKVLKKDKATKAAFLDNAPKYTYLLLATHGFFADESETPAVADAMRGLRSFTMDRGLVGRNPALLSGVVFAGVNRTDRPKEEAILTALEAGELDLSKTELVVLSACETGRGKVAGGEGVLGLQRAFQVAGARATVASLWKVPDAQTSQLMGEFYRRLWDETKPLPPAEAMRQAQLWMLKEGKRGVQPPDDGRKDAPLSPHFWAAFVLSGDPR